MPTVHEVPNGRRRWCASRPLPGATAGAYLVAVEYGGSAPSVPGWSSAESKGGRVRWISFLAMLGSVAGCGSRESTREAAGAAGSAAAVAKAPAVVASARPLEVVRAFMAAGDRGDAGAALALVHAAAAPERDAV